MKKGFLPVLQVVGRNLPQAFESALVAVWEKGIEMATHYDKEDGNPSLEAMVTVILENPFEEPRIPKGIIGGPEELEVYRQEVVEGIHDKWVDDNPETSVWPYSYHERLFSYPVRDETGALRKVDQIDTLLNMLAENITNKRAEAITWRPDYDPNSTKSAPCFQRMWFRAVPAENGYLLNMHTYWRSRDMFKAWPMNVYGFTDLQRVFAENLSEKIGEPVSVGRYVDTSDSLHIYGDDWERAEREVSRIKASPDGCFTDERAYRSDEEVIQSVFDETRLILLADPMYQKKPMTERPVVTGQDRVRLSDGTELTHKDGKLFTAEGAEYRPSEQE